MLTTVERKCVWQKYVDPLNANLDETEWPGFESASENPNVEFYDFADDNVATVKKDFNEDFLRNLGKKIHSIRPLKVVNTKLGLLTVTENAVADYHFDFWTLHTNFGISDEIAKIICETPGVDAFIPMTRYRCRIGFPKSGLFDVKEVKLEIQKRICFQENIGDIEPDNLKAVFPDNIKEKIDAKLGELKSRSKYWALYVLPNGEMEILESEVPSDIFKSKLKVFEETQKLAGGQVFKY